MSHEGKIYRETITCSVTFGKSKLISYDTFQMDVTNKVQQIINSNSTKEYPSVVFTHYITIKNISNQPIAITKDFIAWNDAPFLRNDNQQINLLPRETYQIPAQMNMDIKYKFQYEGRILVFPDEMREAHYCQIFSNYKRKK